MVEGRRDEIDAAFFIHTYERRFTLAELLVVDGHALAFRAFFGFPSIHFSPEGEPVNAVQGFGSMLVSTIRKYDPDMISVIFDAPGKSFRNELFPEYKAHRPSVPEELTSQFPLIHEFLSCMGVPCVIVESVEGDDVLATLSLARVARGDSVRILSPDKDLCQLLTEQNISILKYDGRTGNYEEMDGCSFVSKFGFRPEYFKDYLALIGDRADNIPGVKGIGKKTASALIREFGDLQMIYNNLDLIKPVVRRKLEAEKDIAYLSRDLVTLVEDVVLPEKVLATCCIDPDLLYDFCSSKGLEYLFNRCMG